MPPTIHNLNKFLWASVRRCFRKFLKNTGRFQGRPLDVLESFSKTREVSGRFGRSCGLDSRFRFRLFASTTLNHELKVGWFWRNSFFLQSAPQTVLRYGTKTDVLWSEFFRVVTSQTKNGFFLGSGIFRFVNKKGPVCGQDFSRTQPTVYSR